VDSIIEDPQRVARMYDENLGIWKVVRKDRGSYKSIELIETMLQKLGLSKNEIRVYIFLARSRERKASEVSEVLGLHRTETYRVLRELEKRGLVSSVFEKPLKFIGTPFERAIEALIEAKKFRIQRLEKKKQDLIDIWLSLPSPEVEQETKEVFQILEGEEQIDFKANEMVESAQEELSIFSSEEDLARLYHSGLIDRLEKLSKKNFDVKLLTNNSPKSRFFVEKIRLTNARYAKSDIKDLPTFILADQEQLLFMIRKNNKKCGVKAKRVKLAALWTNYEAFLKALTELFSGLWRVKDTLNERPRSLSVVIK